MGNERRNRWIMAAVLLATCVTLLPKLGNSFVYDDIPVFVINDTIHDPANIPALFTHNAIWVAGRLDPMVIDTYRPLTLTTFALDSIWTGRNPLGYHIVNLLMHLVCVLLVYRVGLVVMRPENRDFAWLAAAWFGLSPWLGEAHLWINGRSDPLCTLFVMLSLLAWDRALTTRRLHLHAAAAVSMLCALLCKEVALGILPSLLLWPTLQRSRDSLGRRLLALSGPAIGAGVYLAVRLVVLGGMKSHGDTAQLGEALGNLGLLFFDGLRATLLPSPPYLKSLVESYVGVPQGVRWLALVGAAVVVLGAVAVRRRHPALAWSTLAFTGTLAPACLITTLVWPGFGRYLYLPLACLSVGVVDALASEANRIGLLQKPATKRILLGAIVVYLAASAFLLSRFTRDFENDGTLYGAVIEAVPEQAYGHGYLGASLVFHGHADVAVGYLREAVRIQPYEPRYRSFLGQALIHSGAKDEAAALAEQWLRSGRKQDAPFYLVIIMDAVDSSEPTRATAAGLACVRENPGWGTCLERLATLANEHERAEEYRRIIAEQLQQRQNQAIAEQVEAATLRAR